ncbi:hypothetical protein Poly30_50720 [Planctomycetes bacterium Poly30]|uniref:DoxX n=1 Tax=Saltatorellus ferox TaxID=2528018 RepID=A0A518EZK6_9BACT|nr:hypothetical protein Poly30_50720 [Planctomycetes bacterium Poly30]
MTHTLSLILQVILSLGLLNVWLVRAGSGTAYRGGSANSLKEEFHAYGLSDGIFYLVGFLKVSCAIALLVGIWVPSLVLPAAAVLVLLMLGALAMHVKVGDPPKKSVPAFLMLAMSSAVVAISLS